MTQVLSKSSLISNPKDLVHQLLERKRAKNSLLSYARFIDGTYEPYSIHEHIAEQLERVESGACRRLAIFVPPASGKSRLSSELFPSWLLGRNPEMEVIAASYDYDLAKGFGRIVRNLIMEPRFQLVFPGVEVAADASSMDEWKTVQKGEYKAQGVGGGLIGFHANIAIIDDPVKNYVQAASISERKKIWEWYSSTLLNRLRSYKGGPGAVILIMQRWHDDDLGGRIEKLHESGEEHWEIISLPSFAEAGDPLGRAVGEPLLPEGPNQRTKKELETIRNHNPALFMALHQQKPVADKGDIFHPDWLRTYPVGKLPAGLILYGVSDYALSKGSGDYTVHIIFGVDSQNHVWIKDLWRAQCEAGDGVDQAIAMMKAHRPLKWFSEKFMITKAIGPLLTRRKKEERVWTVLESVQAQHAGNKAMKAGAIAGAMQLGYVHVPEDAPWLGDMKWELARFPNTKNDDIVDALALIGLKLDTLRGTPVRAELEADSFPLRAAGFTFNQAVERRTRTRKGLRNTREAPLLEAPRCEWLEEA